MKRLIVTILLFMLAVCLTGCVSVTRHERKIVRNAPVPERRRPVIIRPANPPRHDAHHRIARRPHPRDRHSRH
jgi:hypothetical protein